MERPVEQLQDVLERTKALPVLFVGSGIPRRYLQTPDWDGLLEHFASMTTRPIAYYRGLANNDRPLVASKIAEEFYDVWFNDATFESSREVYQDKVQNISDPLKFEIAEFISAFTVPASESVTSELSALSGVRVHAVITTNWDSILEDHLDDLEVFVGQQDVLFATTQAVGEIYKIHGSASDPKSMVVTSEDYEAYWDKNPYLIAKLLTMLVEHPVLFLGYSLGDAHINKMLGNLIDCLSEEQVEVLNDRLVFVRRSRESEQSALQRSAITVGTHTLRVREYICADYAELFGMLGALPERFPAKLLRRLRESVYELTFSTEPTGRVHVLPIEDGKNMDDIEVVVGVGTMERLGEKGYSPIGRAEICHDMLLAETRHNSTRLFEDLLPRLLRAAKFVPIYYPLFLAGRLDGRGEALNTDAVPPNGRALITGATKLDPYNLGSTTRAELQKQSFRALLATEDHGLIVEGGLVCSYDVEDVVALRGFLIANVPKTGSFGTDLAKLCCKYDQLVYGPAFAGDREQLHHAVGVLMGGRQSAK